MSQYNILYTSHFSSLKGGGQRSLALLLKALDKATYHPVVLFPEDGEFVEELKKHNIDTVIYSLPSLKSFNFFERRRTYSDLKDLLREYNIDLIHTDSSRNTFYLGKVAQQCHVPLIQHVRVSDAEPHIYEHILYNRSTKIIAVSQAAKSRFHNWREYDRKVHIVYNAVDTHLFHPANDGSKFRRQLGVDKQILVGLVGEYEENKRQDLLIEAAQEICVEYSDVHFCFVGSSENGHKEKLMKMAQDYHLDNVIHFLDFYEDAPSMMAGIDILVNASNMEGFSRVIIEAMASGTPVVASRVGGNPEAIVDGETGFLFEPGNYHELALYLGKLIQDHQLRQDIGLAAASTAQCFSVDHQIEDIVNVYQGLLH